ncbi:hypothetical protein P9112_010726 [Eukaryota sp. TZLM1-RC]
MSVTNDSLSDSYIGSFSLGASVLNKQRRGRKKKHNPNNTFASNETADLYSLMAEQQHGITLFGILHCRIISASHLISVAPYTQLYAKVAIQGFSKRSAVTMLQSSSSVTLSATKLLPITINRNPRHPDNLLRFTLLSVSKHHQPDLTIGAVSFNLHDIVKSKSIVGTFDIYSGDVVSGRLSIEIDFFYGVHGFGYSCQLRDLNISAPQQIEKSLFPRLEPPTDRADDTRGTILPRAQHHPAFVEFCGHETILGIGKQFESQLPPPTSREESDTAPGKFISDGGERFPLLEEYLKNSDYSGKVSRVIDCQSRLQRLKTLNNELFTNISKREHVLSEKSSIDTSQKSVGNKGFLKFMKPVKKK